MLASFFILFLPANRQKLLTDFRETPNGVISVWNPNHHLQHFCSLSRLQNLLLLRVLQEQNPSISQRQTLPSRFCWDSLRLSGPNQNSFRVPQVRLAGIGN